jgi:anthranilate synthase component 1
MDFEGNFNHAIMIRTFLSKNQLHSQAGAGIVAGSDEESGREEYNKLRALNKARFSRNYLKNNLKI